MEKNMMAKIALMEDWSAGATATWCTLSNDCCNNDDDQCRRRSQGGTITIPRPISICKYNKYMGGVDLADMRRLHCNSTVMGQNRWWLKLFFYLLDVGTSNALVLYNLSLKATTETAGRNFNKVNIATFKLRLIKKLAGKKIEGLPDEGRDRRRTYSDINS
jgi:Transposase IS4